MSEAAFTITADITPQINDRELERQAHSIANQLNSILSKQVSKVGVKAESGNFKPFEQELERSRGLIDKLQTSAKGIPGALSRVGQAGRGAFLKFTDAINVTRREMVGFGGGILETVKATNMFETALDGIKEAGSTISTLPEGFENLSAQIRSGMSDIDRMAAVGNPLAQMFQPLQQQGEAARTEFVELNRSIDMLVAAMGRVAGAAVESGSVVKNQFGQTKFNEQIMSLEELKTMLKDTPILFDKIKGSIEQANNTGTLAGIVTELVDIKDAAQKITGPMGRIAQFINEKSKGKFFADNTAAARELAIELEQGAIAKLREFGANEVLSRFERITARLREMKDAAEAVGRGIATAGRVISGVSNVFLDFTGLRAPVDAIVNSFDTMAASVVDRVKGFGKQTTDAISSIMSSLGTIVTGKLDQALAPIAGKVGKSLGQVAGFLEKNLNAPMRQGLQNLKTEVVRLGGDIAGGLGKGIQNGKAALISAVSQIKDTIFGGIKRLFGIASDAKVMVPIGRNIVGGILQGIRSAAGLVGKAISGLMQGVGALISSGLQFAKSAALVTSAAFAGLAATALYTGKEFNVLKQVINASLPVIVGSKEAAADLLEEVNLLNDSSPYARSAFLELTRVLAGFGVEAAKITPLIDAIQQTVAATGGTEEDLNELGQAFAKIQTQGRLSADILQSFSVRGVDAIAILGKEMGKTNAEIKNMISDGLISADIAIDNLTKGLKEKFDGATEAVSKNFPGALQRVQARLRDIGGVLLTAFINPAGGGALVDFLNNMADSLLHVRELLKSDKIQSYFIKMGEALVFVSEKIESFVTSLSSANFDKFISGLGPVLPLLAAFVGFMPAMLGFIPVIGPMLAGLGGPFTALALGLGVAAAQGGNFGKVMEQISEVVSGAFTFIKEHVNGVIVAVGGMFSMASKAGGAVAGGFTAVAAGGGKMAGIFSKLAPIFQGIISKFPMLTNAAKLVSGPVGIIISILIQLLVTSGEFRAALGRLIAAIKPVAEIIMGVLGVAIKILDGALKALTPVFVLIVDLLGAWFRSFKPVLDQIKKWIKAIQDSGVIEEIFKKIGEIIAWVVDKIRMFIDWYNKIPFLPNVELGIDTSELDAAQKKIKDDLKATKKAAEESAAAIEDNYKKAAKGVETANAAMSASIDSFKQAIASADSMISGVIDSARAVKNASKAIDDARAKHREAQKSEEKARETAIEAGQDIIDLEKEKAKALADSITPINEQGVALRALSRIQRGLANIEKEKRDIVKQQAAIEKENADLRGEKAADDRAALARAEERAQIGLNRAKQAELDLLDELNGKQKVSINLAGLSLDQIRAKLAAARLSNKAERGERDKTPQEIADLKRSAALDVEDAQQASKDATAARGQFELDIQTKIAENDEALIETRERLKELDEDKADALLEEQTALKNIEKLRQGETTQQQIILDFDDKIKEAKDKQQTATEAISTAVLATKTASEGINTAVQASKLAIADMQLKTATMRGDTDGIWAAQKEIWRLKSEGLGFDQLTQTAIAGQLGTVNAMAAKVKEAKNDVMEAQRVLASAGAIQSMGLEIEQSDVFWDRVSKDDTWSHGRTLQAAQIRTDVTNAIRSALLAGGAEIKATKLPWLPNAATVETMIKEIMDSQDDLRTAIRKALEKRGLSMPGFAAAHGYAPGDLVHRGMNDGVGVMRWAEFGKEAILPLTRKFDMARVVQNPAVLPAVLNALPRWRMPESTNLSDSSVSDLSTMIRSGRSGGGPANSDVYQKKSQREFANTIGNAVYTAVKAAIDESDGLGSDVDINVMPSSGNEKLIAREVKRQVDKALGKKW